ncbi:MAG: SRPBCC family protein [Frankiaceae bacterium]|nr:SRPBCC family protein [Frankiaceae bacterium]MBV9872100.1 SRPBCC family protein [Frankiaceae bacterium]
MQRIEIDHDFALPVERVYAYLAEHENLGPMFGAKVARVRDGDDSRNGVGSVRQLRIGILPPFEETVTGAVANESIDYEITKGSPLRNHHGTMTFSSTGTGSHLNYVIEFGAVAPGLDRVIKPGLERAIRKGLKTVDAKA